MRSWEKDMESLPITSLQLGIEQDQRIWNIKHGRQQQQQRGYIRAKLWLQAI